MFSTTATAFSILLLLAVAAAAMVDLASAFQSITLRPIDRPSTRAETARTTTALGMFGFFSTTKDASKANPNQAKKKAPPPPAVVTVNGKPVPSARPGQTVLTVARRAGFKIPTYCERGACGTCVCYLNGRKVHACKEKLPKGRAEIQTVDLQ